jgi:hypothetical protein
MKNGIAWVRVRRLACGVAFGVLIGAGASLQPVQAQGFFEKLNQDFQQFNRKMSGQGPQPIDGGTGANDGAESDGMQAVDGGTPASPQEIDNPRQSLGDLLDQTDEIRENMRRLKARMARVLHRVRVSQMAVGEQYVAMAEEMVAANKLFQKAVQGDGGTLARLARAAEGTRMQARKVTQFAMDYEAEPDLKQLVVRAYANTRQIVDLQDAVRELRVEYAEIFGRIDNDLGRIDPASFRGQANRQKALLRDARIVGDRLTTPLIRRAAKGKVMLRHLSNEYGELYQEMQVAIDEFEDTGGRYALEASKQAVVIGLHVAALSAQDTDSVAGIIGTAVTGISLISQATTAIDELQEFVAFNEWFGEVSETLIDMNHQMRDQIRMASGDVGTVNAEVQKFQEALVGRMQTILAGQRSGMRAAAADYEAFKADMQAAAREAAAAGRDDGRAERENLAQGMQTGFFAGA